MRKKQICNRGYPNVNNDIIKISEEGVVKQEQLSGLYCRYQLRYAARLSAYRTSSDKFPRLWTLHADIHREDAH